MFMEIVFQLLVIYTIHAYFETLERGSDNISGIYINKETIWEVYYLAAAAHIKQHLLTISWLAVVPPHPS